MSLECFYLDACSTTPMHQSVIEEINLINQNFYGNPSSLHYQGLQSANILEIARRDIANSFNTYYDDIIFTSGATESVNLAIKGLTSRIEPARMIISSVEHSAVKNTANSLKDKGWIIKEWPVDNRGNLNLDYLEELLSPPTKFVSIIWAQSEIGTVQPIHILAHECKKRDIIFHTDATQLIPHTLIDFKNLPIDLLSASAHKFQGPKGIGILLVKKNIRSCLRPILDGGNQEFGYRSGTEPISLISGMNVAIKRLEHKINFDNEKIIFAESNVFNITKLLLNLLTEIKGVRIVGNNFDSNRIPNHISILVSDKYGKPLSSRDLVRDLSTRGVYVSSGSACTSTNTNVNDTLKAMNYDDNWLGSCLRISTGEWIDQTRLVRIAEIFEEVLSTY
tara:strand:- start:166 stop:1344 length:1179 start_codon:yes stop_codon:yes gene_type:complete